MRIVMSSPPEFQSTLLMRGATAITLYPMHSSRISIHAPHARSDPTIANVLPLPSYFNPRSSCEERQHFGFPYRLF